MEADAEQKIKTLCPNAEYDGLNLEKRQINLHIQIYTRSRRGEEHEHFHDKQHRKTSQGALTSRMNIAGEAYYPFHQMLPFVAGNEKLI